MKTSLGSHALFARSAILGSSRKAHLTHQEKQNGLYLGLKNYD